MIPACSPRSSEWRRLCGTDQTVGIAISVGENYRQLLPLRLGYQDKWRLHVFPQRFSRWQKVSSCCQIGHVAASLSHRGRRSGGGGGGGGGGGDRSWRNQRSTRLLAPHPVFCCCRSFNYTCPINEVFHELISYNGTSEWNSTKPRLNRRCRLPDRCMPRHRCMPRDRCMQRTRSVSLWQSYCVVQQLPLIGGLCIGRPLSDTWQRLRGVPLITSSSASSLFFSLTSSPSPRLIEAREAMKRSATEKGGGGEGSGRGGEENEAPSLKKTKLSVAEETSKANTATPSGKNATSSGKNATSSAKNATSSAKNATSASRKSAGSSPAKKPSSAAATSAAKTAAAADVASSDVAAGATNQTPTSGRDEGRTKTKEGGGGGGRREVDDVRVNPKRVRVLKPKQKKPDVDKVVGKAVDVNTGPVIYWMSRDQRSCDNWALLHAWEEAREREVPLAVVFNLVPKFLGAGARHFGFLLRGLKVVAGKLEERKIPFFLFRGEAMDTIPAFVEECHASLLVMDFSPLRIGRKWRDTICEKVSIPVHEVDAHNVVPVWVASEKLEYGARTIRTKIHKNLPEFLVPFPALPDAPRPWSSPDKGGKLKLPQVRPIDWDKLIEQALRIGADVPEVDWCLPGEDNAIEWLMGEKSGFVTKRLAKYDSMRNDPSKHGALSGISPWLHFGQISAQRCALEAKKARKQYPQAVDAFLEELIVRRELADNYCYYQPKYDSLAGAWDWARYSLQQHAADKREYIYTKEQFEKGKTHDPLWNAAQLEMVHYGKMHGFMRMYWAKKILEWTSSPEEALSVAIYLNDKYELDGRDPNGYVGCMWSIAGIHDQGWAERPVFGKIRYMNFNGCKRKFDVEAYVQFVNKLTSNVLKKKREAAAGGAPASAKGSDSAVKTAPSKGSGLAAKVAAKG
ncbi:hypothetical protein CBR_g17934 [Chara braunii]|nr:hypothetical protein CBR_g17934 [Chara braunii]|eukprot:GBG74222.1 hypothetical protein CBR_g17934 [Chara braunii]